MGEGPEIHHARLPEGFREDSPAAALFDRRRGGVLAFVDGLPSMGKTVFLQRCATEILSSHLVFWWGESRPQWLTFYPDRYQLLVAKGLKTRMVKQFPGEAREEKAAQRVVPNLDEPEGFYSAAKRDLLNVLVYDPSTRNVDVLTFLEWLLQRPGLEHVAVFIDETAKIAPGTVTRYDGSFDRGIRFARILEDTRKAGISVFMSSHAPSDLWYVCLNKVQFHVAAAGKHNPKDRHSRQAQDALSVGQFYVNGPTLKGKRYDALDLAAPPEPPWRLYLRIESESDGMAPPMPAAAAAGGRPQASIGCPWCLRLFSRPDVLSRHQRSCRQRPQPAAEGLAA